jgi:hypothetical protein
MSLALDLALGVKVYDGLDTQGRESSMDITLQYFDGCPNWRLAEQRLHEALQVRAAGSFRVIYERIETAEQAEKAHFRGSPTILLDGRDPFASGTGPVGLACRIYETESGLDGAPSVDQLALIVARRPRDAERLVG